MNDHDRDIDDRLEKLGRATGSIGPRPDFSARVARAIAAEPRGGVIVELRRPARRILPALAFAAALCLVWAVESDDAFDDALSAFPYETVELEW